MIIFEQLREKKSGLRTKMKSFHSGYSDQEVRIKVYPFSFQLSYHKGLLLHLL